MRLPFFQVSRTRPRGVVVARGAAIATLVGLTTVFGAGCGGGGGAVTVTPAIPAAPLALTATGQNNQVYLVWNLSPGATGYNVYRNDIATATHLLQGSVVQTTFTDMTAVNGQAYTYEVTATNISGESPKSAPVTATPTAGFTFSISPQQSNLNLGQSQVFTAPVSGPGTDPALVTFTIQNAVGQVISNGSAGTLSAKTLVAGVPTVTYTAPSPATPQTYFVVANYPVTATHPTADNRSAAVIVGAGSGGVVIPIQ